MQIPQLSDLVRGQRSYLCIGLDTDMTRIPGHLLSSQDPVFEFNKRIIDVTREYCVAYKPNIAFYEALGSKGWDSLGRTIDYIGGTHFKIADAKRGDIGNTSRLYAKTFFETFAFDAVTVAPYMGKDSILPFLEYEDKCIILLALTSNEGSGDFQKLSVSNGRKLYQKIVLESANWASPDQLMFVVGATHPEELGQLRSLVPAHWFLVPGVGAQGGDLRDISLKGFHSKCGILVNASRSIIYAGDGEDFDEAAALAAKKLQAEMDGLLQLTLS